MTNAHSGFRHPPQAPPIFTTTPDRLIQDARDLIAAYQAIEDNIVSSVSPETSTFATAITPLAHAENARLSRSRQLQFYANVAPDPAVRKSAEQACTLFGDLGRDTARRSDLALLVEAVWEHEGATLDAEDAHLLRRMRRGHHSHDALLSSSPERERLQLIRRRLDEVVDTFHENVARLDRTGDGKVWFTPQELEGVPDEFVARLTKGAGDNEGKLLAQNFGPIAYYATSGQTRKRAKMASLNKCNANIAVFKEAVALRDEAARVLGFDNHAAFMMADRMIKSPEVVDRFLADVVGRLVANGRKEIDELKRLKREDLESRGEPTDDHFFVWDLDFYQDKFKSKQLPMDRTRISEYFPIEAVVPAMLKMFQRLFGIEFVPMDTNARNQISPSGHGDDIVWHEDVQLFAVWDDNQKGNGFLGYLYLDLFRRDGKKEGMRECNVVPVCALCRPGSVTFAEMQTNNALQGFAREDGTRNYPVASLLWNFPKPTAEKPSLMNMFNLQLYLLHEFGHGIHDLVSKTRYARFHGPDGCAIDFGEIPSQVLENWCWVPSQLKTLSQHYSTLSPEYLKHWREKTGCETAPPPEQMPDEMVDAVIRARHVNKAMFHLNQLHLAAFDLAIYRPGSPEDAKDMNVSAIWGRSSREITLLEGPLDQGDDWANGYTDFSPSMTSDYTAGYHCYYLWVPFCRDRVSFQL